MLQLIGTMLLRHAGTQSIRPLHPSLLALVLAAKYGQHLPLTRQSAIYAREGVELDVSTLAGWVGSSTASLMPLVLEVRAHVFAAERLHGDDTTVPVLAKEQTKIGRVWGYVRDDRPFGGPDPPAAAFFYSPDREGIHPERHLAGFAGILQADAYGGFNRLYEPNREPGPILEAACRVGGVVADPAPHRPGRADFPHPVPRARASLTARRTGGRSWGVGEDVARAWRGSAARTACCAVRAV
jgi:transposase